VGAVDNAVLSSSFLTGHYAPTETDPPSTSVRQTFATIRRLRGIHGKLERWAKLKRQKRNTGNDRATRL